MKIINQTSLLYFLVILTLTIAPTFVHPRTSSTTDLVTTTCNQTPDPAICETELRSDRRSSKTNTEGLILIMIDKVKSQFSDSLQYVQGMSRKTRDPDMIRAWRDCVRVYQVVLNTNVGLAVRAVRQGDPKFGESAMLDSGNEAEACRLAFPEGKVPGPVVGRTKVLHGVSSVAASMIKTLE